MRKSLKQKLFMFMSLAFIVSILVACGNSNDASGNNNGNGGGNGDVTIEIVAKGFQHDFWRAVKLGAEEAAEDLGAKINFVGPKDEQAIAEQVEMLNNAINKNPSAVALAALDTEASLDAISQATNAEIPIIGFDSGVPDAPEGAIAANAATDNYEAGALAAENMYPGIEDKLTGEDIVRIGVVAQEENSLSITERTVGFIDKLVELIEDNDAIGDGNVAVAGHDKLKNDVKADDAKVIIETRVPATINDAAGQTEAQTLLEKDDLIAIYGSNEFAAKSIINADDALSGNVIGKDGVIAVGFDSGAMQIDAIKNERFYGSVTQDPVQIGYQTVELAIKAANGEEVEDVDTGAVWYNAENIEDEDVQPLLYE